MFLGALKEVFAPIHPRRWEKRRWYRFRNLDHYSSTFLPQTFLIWVFCHVCCNNQKPFWPFPLSPWLSASLKPSQCMVGYHPEQLQHTCDQPNTKLSQIFLIFWPTLTSVTNSHGQTTDLVMSLHCSKSESLFLSWQISFSYSLSHAIWKHRPFSTEHHLLQFYSLTQPRTYSSGGWRFMISATYCQNLQFLGYFSFCCPFLINPQPWINPPKCPSAPNN